MTFAEEILALNAEFYVSDMFDDATLTKAGYGETFDPITSTVIAGAPVSFPVRVSFDTEETTAADGSPVRTTTAELNAEAERGDTLTINGVDWLVGETWTDYAGATPVGYMAKVTR